LDERIFTDEHGVDVFFRRWSIDDPRAVVVILHGASEHSGRYARFAEALNAHGCAAYAIDHRGHGETSAVTGVGLIGAGGGQAVIDDVHELVKIAESEHIDTPIVLFGHSLGSIIGLGYLTQHSVGLRAGVLSGFATPLGEEAAGLRGLFQGMVDAGQADDPVDILGSFNAAFEPARTPFDWLSRDEAEVDAYVADPYCGDAHKLTYGYFAALFNAAGDSIEPKALAEIACPVLLITGDQDAAAGMGANATALETALRDVGVDVTSLLYEGARHELLNETNRDEVTDDVIGWIGDHLPA
jgi:alpha-beta hydrolase superfamily lysophospholipase